MLNCPNCNGLVPNRLQTCPGCGVVVRHAPSTAPDNEVVTSPLGLKRGEPSTDSTNIGRRRFRPVILAGLFLAGVVSTMMYLGIQQSREAVRRTTARCRLKQLGLASHNFSDQFGHFPPKNLHTLTKDPAITISSSAVPQSFFTDILPYIDQAALYNRLDTTLPWKNPAQQPVFSAVISTYQHPSVPKPPRNEEGYALAHYATNSKCICDTKTVTLAEITDGTSNTMLLATVNDGYQAWGDPTNYRDPGKGFGGGPEAFGAIDRGNLIQVLMFDGSVRSVSANTPIDICTKLGDPRDGQPIGDF